MFFSTFAKEFEKNINETNIKSKSQNLIRDCRKDSSKEKFLIKKHTKKEKIICKRQEIQEKKLKRGTKLLKRNLDGNQEYSFLNEYT